MTELDYHPHHELMVQARRAAEYERERKEQWEAKYFEYRDWQRIKTGGIKLLGDTTDEPGDALTSVLTNQDYPPAEPTTQIHYYSTPSGPVISTHKPSLAHNLVHFHKEPGCF